MHEDGEVATFDNDLAEFIGLFEPLEADHLYPLVDRRTDARFVECHIRAAKLVPQSTIDVPLDPEDQPDYRANRELVEDATAFLQMKADAVKGRSFSNLVAEFTTTFDAEHPLKIIGGQHRCIAIREALQCGVDEYHGVKVYFGLDSEKRLDVQLISNTNIAVSSDLIDRMLETVSGPDLRTWCHRVGLLADNQDFADRREWGQPITVRAARTFIVNYLQGREIDPREFDSTKTTPTMARTGIRDPEWEELRRKNPGMWEDAELLEAGQEFALLDKAQRDYFRQDREGAASRDFAEKAMNYAVLSAWAYIAGMLHSNAVRLRRHFNLRKITGVDPLNAAALAKGRHKTDAENYRGLGYRTDAKERGRFVELFFLQAEDGKGISKRTVELALAKYHAKQALLEVKKVEAKV